MSHEDFITLNGQTYIIEGAATGKAISEFSAGFKIGKATYDDREHAFYLVLDDFSGGIGFHRVDSHEALGGIWDSVGGVDVRRANHVTLPPQRTTLAGAATANLGFSANNRSIILSDIGGAEFLYCVAGNKVYRMDATRAALNTAGTLAGTGLPAGTCIFEWRDKETNTRRLYVPTIDGSLTSKYFTSIDGTTWVQQSRVVWEGLVWDNKFVASLPCAFTEAASKQTIGQIVCSFSTDGLNWDIDNLMAGSTTVHNRPIWYFQGFPKWIGIAMAPWGVVAPYFLDFGKLYVLDFYLQTAREVEEVGDKTRLTCGGVYEGQILVSDGYSIWMYDPGASATVRRIGIYNRFGIPPSLRGYTVSTFIGGTSTLYAVLDDNLNAKMRIMTYTGVGWSPLGPAVTAANPIGAVVDRFPIGQSVNTPSRFIDILANQAEQGQNITLHSWKLPTSGDIPTTGDGFFESGSLSLETGWYDGGFLDLQGALHRIHVDGLNITANETVQVEYRLDMNEAGGYTNLGTFTSNLGTLWFDSANHRGVTFTTVQFRITLTRGGTNSNTPELVGLTLVYDKKPSFRSAWSMTIDVNRMIEAGTLVGGQPPTPLNIWNALQTAYNVKTLIPLIVPNVQPTPGINVRIVDMPLTYDDFRDAVTGKGKIDISVLQPLGDPNP
jgi:hypothetical protein